MKKITLFTALLFSLAVFSQQALQQSSAAMPALGQMAFTAFNADGDDDFAMVTFTDIAANTTIYFSDKEWTGSAFNSGEASYAWETGAAVIPAGTVIRFNTISATPSVTFGTIVGAPGGLSTGSEAIFAYTGTQETPANFIAAVANSSAAYGTLENTGLIEGFTAQTLPEGTDIADYKGARTGLDQAGYQLALNSLTNYDLQDTGDDDSVDGVVPDVPLNETIFIISATDVTAPQVVNTSVNSATALTVVFSEAVTAVSAETISNYTIAPAVAITSVTYNATNNSITIVHEGLAEGVAHTLTVANVEDTAAMVMEMPYTSQDLFYNSLTEGLIFTEIMYNAPSDNSNALEFVEIYNTTGATISLGGIKVKDEDSFVFTFPEVALLSNETILLATDKVSADAFYGVDFIDLPQEISNAFGNGGEVLEILNSENTVISSATYDDNSDWPLADGAGPSLELLNPEGDFNDPFNWTAATNLVGPSLGEDVFASPGVFVPVTNSVPTVSFSEAYTSIAEDGGTVTVTVQISEAPATEGTVTLSLVAGGTAAQGTDFTFAAPQDITFAVGSTVSQTVEIPVVNNSEDGSDLFFILSLEDASNVTIGGETFFAVYILDDDTQVPAGDATPLDVTFLSSYLVDPSGTAEITAYDPISQRLFVTNSTSIEALDFSDTENITAIGSFDITPIGSVIQSVAVKNGIVAAAISANNPTDNGFVLFGDIDGNNLVVVEVGSLPDMITFSPDGTKVLTANEGQPNDDYTVDPEGSISVIDVTGGLINITQDNVTTLNFNAFNSQEAALKAAGVRIFGPGASVSQDMEPEYIAVSDDSQKAYVTLQENNAYAIVNLTAMTIEEIIPLGLKDHSLPQNSLDTSDETDFIFNASWPIKGVYMPDAVAYYSVAGVDYIVTANEGDARDYSGYAEERKLDDSDYVLDPSVFSNIDILQLETALGDINFTAASGDADGDGLYEEMHVFGGRSFSIFEAATGNLQYDSGNDFEVITAADPVYGPIFNSSNENNNFKNRSDNKGPEPEGVLVKELEGQFYAFILLERVGGIMVYNVTDPVNPVFLQYVNNREATAGGDEMGDLGPEGIAFVEAAESPTGNALVIVSNEVSATVSVYSLENIFLSVTENELAAHSVFKMYPNPATANVFFDQAGDYRVFDTLGRLIITKNNTISLSILGLQSGAYIVMNKAGASQKLIVK